MDRLVVHAKHGGNRPGAHACGRKLLDDFAAHIRRQLGESVTETILYVRAGTVVAEDGIRVAVQSLTDEGHNGGVVIGNRVEANADACGKAFCAIVSKFGKDRRQGVHALNPLPERTRRNDESVSPWGLGGVGATLLAST
jgi:hypothetical protein